MRPAVFFVSGGYVTDRTPQNTFVVRLWRERGGEEADSIQRWHGRIDHLQSGEGIAFHDWDQLLEFMQRLGVLLESSAVAGESQNRKGGNPKNANSNVSRREAAQLKKLTDGHSKAIMENCNHWTLAILLTESAPYRVQTN